MPPVMATLEPFIGRRLLWTTSDTFASRMGRLSLGGKSSSSGCVARSSMSRAPGAGLIDMGGLAQPLSITHVNAHADIGLGGSGYTYLLSDLLRKPVQERHFPRIGDGGMDDGNYLIFAIACHWIRDLTYVYNAQGRTRATSSSA